MAETLQQMIDTALLRTPVTHHAETREVHMVPTQEALQRRGIMNRLSARGVPPQADRVHIGIAGFFNFDIAGITRPNYMLLLDNNTNQHRLWGEVLTILKEQDSPRGFYHEINKRLSSNDDVFVCADGSPLALFNDTRDCLQYLYHASWITNEDAYRHLRQLALEDRIATASIDLIQDPERAAAIGACLQRGPFHVDTCYWSNLATFHVPRNSTPVVTNYTDMVLQRCGRDQAPKTRGFDQFSAFDKMLHNVSLIGGDNNAMHMLCGTVPNQPLTITEGPPDRTQAQGAYR